MNAQEKIAALNLNGKVRREAMQEIGQDTIMSILSERGSAKALAEKLQFANSGALSVATGDLGWREVGHRDNGDGEVEGEKKPAKQRAKGVLPATTAAWAATQLMAAHCATGGDADEFDPPELTPEIFREIPAFRLQRNGWLKHIEEKLGGINGDAAKAFRQWLGVPITAAQAEAEAEAEVETRRKMKIASLKSCLDAAAKLANELMMLDVSNGIAETLERLDAVV